MTQRPPPAEANFPDRNPARASLTIALVGDSTVAEYAPDSPWRGWGQILPNFLKPGVTVRNLAVNGMSTKTFRDTPHWDEVIALRPEIVLIQFGHNDSHPSPAPEGTAAGGEFKTNLRAYILEARAVGVRPILVTPMHRRTFDEFSKPTGELAQYAAAVREIGESLAAPVIDLHARSGELFETLGEKGSDPLTLADDRTHFTEAGATEMALLVVKEFARVDRNLSENLFRAAAARPQSSREVS